MITITETLYKKMPDDIKACFSQLPNHSSEEVKECFPESTSGAKKANQKSYNHEGKEFIATLGASVNEYQASSGNASRFFKSIQSGGRETEKCLHNGEAVGNILTPPIGFKSIIYQAKASKGERNKGCEGLEEKAKVFNGQSDKPSKDMKDVEKRFTTLPKANNHPTVKPIALMEYLIKMVTPKGGVVLDPFMGSGTTGVACKRLKRNFIGIELDPEYIEIAQSRIDAEPEAML